MGVYMSKPIKDKESTDFTGKLLKCGASSMQGWRVSQEDAHNCCLDFDEDISLFAVYDGHGGHEVAEYASRHLPKVIKDNEAYKKGEYSRALIDAFLEFDATLKTPTVMEELEKISDGKKTKDGRLNEDDDDEEEANVAKLREEASMPLAEVIAMYANGGFPKTPKNKLLAGTSKPMSPFLRAVKPSGSKDSEVSSSSSVPSSSLTNGQPDESTSTTKPSETVSEEPDQSEPAPINQEKSGGSSGCSSSAPEVTSSSTNGEAVASSTTSKEEPSSTSAASSTSPNRPRRERAIKKKDLAASLLENTLSSDDESSNDETFHTNDDGASSSDEEEVQLNGSKDCEDDSDEEEEEDEDEDGDGDGGEEVDEESEAEDEEPGMDSGCTAVVALVTKDKLYVANAGDSRAVLCRNGTAVDLSVDHKPEDPIELKRIQNAGGKVTNDGRVNGGLNLSRALGDHYYKRSADLDAREQMITALPDVLTETLDRTTDEFIVLACDGIWNSMSSQEVVDFVRPLVQKGETLSAICEKLFESCLAPDTMGDGTGCDNMTCVIVQLLPPGSEASNKRPPSDSAEVVERQPDSKKAKLGEETES